MNWQQQAIEALRASNKLLLHARNAKGATEEDRLDYNFQWGYNTQTIAAAPVIPESVPVADPQT